MHRLVAEIGKLTKRESLGFEFRLLQAKHIRLGYFYPSCDIRHACLQRVHIPGGDFHVLS